MKLKVILLAFLFALSLPVFSQYGKVQGVITKGAAHFDFELGGTVVKLSQGEKTIKETIIDNSGKFKFDSIPADYYLLRIKQIGLNELVVDDVVVKADSTLALNVQYPPPCKFGNYSKPVRCPLGDKDQIIPILYGYPSEKMMLLSKKGKILLGGCMISDCDPKYYCKKHKKEF